MPEHCIVKRTLKERIGTNSLSIFRRAYKDEVFSDQFHRRWLASGEVPPEVQLICEDLLNETTLERIRHA